MNGYYQLTKLPDVFLSQWYKAMSETERRLMPAFAEARDSAQRIAFDINKGYGEVAIVVDGCCFVTDEYWIYCQNYVLDNCCLKMSPASAVQFKSKLKKKYNH